MSTLNVKELRVGNWVNITVSGRVLKRAQIAGIDGNKSRALASDQDLEESAFQPIAVTPAILEKFGFKLTHGQMYSYPGGAISVDFVDDPLDTKKKNNIWLAKKKIYSADVIYLHKLQNIAFDLCGLELELNK